MRRTRREQYLTALAIRQDASSSKYSIDDLMKKYAYGRTSVYRILNRKRWANAIDDGHAEFSLLRKKPATFIAIAVLLSQLGIRQADIARYLDLTPGYVCRILNRTSPL